MTIPSSDRTPPSPARIEQSGTAPLTKDQKSFNALLRKIEARRASLRDWEAAVPEFRQAYSRDFLPLLQETMALQGKLAQALDAAHGQTGVTKGEKRKLAALIVELLEPVLACGEQKELKPLLEKHSASVLGAAESEHSDELKAFLKDSLGLDLDAGEDQHSPEDVFERFEALFRPRRGAADQRSGQPRTPSAREEARAARLAAEEERLKQSVQEVFRKLASALHPDREPDAAEKARKTALMQRANQAYEQGNLLELLELQVELEHIDQAYLAALRPERLKQYLKVLQVQVQEMDLELERISDQFALEFGVPPFRQLFPSGLLPMLHQDMAACSRDIKELRKQLEIAADPRRLKNWLKTITLQNSPPFPGFGPLP